MSPPILAATNTLRDFLYQHVYWRPEATEENEKVAFVIETLYRYFLSHPEAIPIELRTIVERRGEPIEQAVVDYIAGMTDRYALAVFKQIFVPRTWGATP
jgi:dGTPase